jgi:hypothetical protein
VTTKPTIDEWLNVWRLSKDAEDAAKDARLTAELQIIAALGKPDNFKGTAHLDGVSVSFGESVKVDGVALRNIVEDHGLNVEIIDELIRWKPELNAKAWKEAPEEIKRALSPALEIKPSKPAFSRTEKKEK